MLELIRGGLDFIADLGSQMPMRVIGMLLGIPEEDQEELRDRIDAGRSLEEGETGGLADSYSSRGRPTSSRAAASRSTSSGGANRDERQFSDPDRLTCSARRSAT